MPGPRRIRDNNTGEEFTMDWYGDAPPTSDDIRLYRQQQADPSRGGTRAWYSPSRIIDEISSGWKSANQGIEGALQGTAIDNLNRATRPEDVTEFMKGAGSTVFGLGKMMVTSPGQAAMDATSQFGSDLAIQEEMNRRSETSGKPDDVSDPWVHASWNAFKSLSPVPIDPLVTIGKGIGYGTYMSDESPGTPAQTAHAIGEVTPLAMLGAQGAYEWWNRPPAPPPGGGGGGGGGGAAGGAEAPPPGAPPAAGVKRTTPIEPDPFDMQSGWGETPAARPPQDITNNPFLSEDIALIKEQGTISPDQLGSAEAIQEYAAQLRGEPPQAPEMPPVQPPAPAEGGISVAGLGEGPNLNSPFLSEDIQLIREHGGPTPEQLGTPEAIHDYAENIRQGGFIDQAPEPPPTDPWANQPLEQPPAGVPEDLPLQPIGPELPPPTDLPLQNNRTPSNPELMAERARFSQALEATNRPPPEAPLPDVAPPVEAPPPLENIAPPSPEAQFQPIHPEWQRTMEAEPDLLPEMLAKAEKLGIDTSEMNSIDELSNAVDAAEASLPDAKTMADYAAEGKTGLKGRTAPLADAIDVGPTPVATRPKAPQITPEQQRMLNAISREGEPTSIKASAPKGEPTIRTETDIKGNNRVWVNDVEFTDRFGPGGPSNYDIVKLRSQIKDPASWKRLAELKGEKYVGMAEPIKATAEPVKALPERAPVVSKGVATFPAAARNLFEVTKGIAEHADNPESAGIIDGLMQRGKDLINKKIGPIKTLEQREALDRRLSEAQTNFVELEHRAKTAESPDAAELYHQLANEQLDKIAEIKKAQKADQKKFGMGEIRPMKDLKKQLRQEGPAEPVSTTTEAPVETPKAPKPRKVKKGKGEPSTSQDTSPKKQTVKEFRDELMRKVQEGIPDAKEQKALDDKLREMWRATDRTGPRAKKILDLLRASRLKNPESGAGKWVTKSMSPETISAGQALRRVAYGKLPIEIGDIVENYLHTGQVELPSPGKAERMGEAHVETVHDTAPRKAPKHSPDFINDSNQVRQLMKEGKNFDEAYVEVTRNYETDAHYEAMHDFIRKGNEVKSKTVRTIDEHLKKIPDTASDTAPRKPKVDPAQALADLFNKRAAEVGDKKWDPSIGKRDPTKLPPSKSVRTQMIVDELSVKDMQDLLRNEKDLTTTADRGGITPEGLRQTLRRILGDEKGQLALSTADLKKLARKSFDVANQVRMTSMLSGLALPKSVIGNVGSHLIAALEHRTLAPFKVLTNVRAIARDLKTGWVHNVNPALTGGVGRFNYFGRAMGAGDYAATESLVRAGIGRADAREILLTNPNAISKWPPFKSRAGQFFVPFRTIPFNQFGQFLTRWKRYPEVYTAAVVLGAVSGANVDDKEKLALMSAFAGPYAIPFLIGAGLTKGARAVEGVSPIPEWGIVKTITKPWAPFTESPGRRWFRTGAGFGPAAAQEKRAEQGLPVGGGRKARGGRRGR
jgi:hypothetical protein